MLANVIKNEVIDNFSVSRQTFFIDKMNYVIFLQIQGQGKMVIPVECHDDWFELDVTPSNLATIKVENIDVISSEDELLLIHPKVLHSISINVDGIFTGFSLFLHKNLFQNSVPEGAHSFLSDPGQRIQKLFDLLRPYFAQSSMIPLDDFMLSIARLIVIETMRRTVKHHLPDEFIRVLNFIEAKFASEITIDDLAKVVCLSRYHFLHRFKKIFGLPPMQYLNNFRLKMAAELLRKQPTMSISEVVFVSGFGDISNFNRKFKQKFFLSPSEYRRYLSNN
ncbi:MAG: hypothetical protein A2381_01455 [Bdellovibrionales bacterium RIFOXYB1_FULL_37_110]|nr:MAG: hypothetical protein A2417_02310 [Bdellovibrionales bacterium RIFOXYC1_FULL_37_79]OFZ58883.1 MAG: hypothetical protein A2381_01455 [Bdellovibrionales bacterium RIFOXYB1_FULL_37_110]OFZ64671.1 MAG: hypothetical protein A2577_13480 [Bdellovibrionales bacterium RIFOXYD1_FULL_36_51]